MFDHTVLCINNSHWHNWVGGGSNSRHYILAFHREWIDYMLSKIKDICQTFMLENLLLTQSLFGMETKRIF